MRSRYPSRHFVQTSARSRDSLICRLAIASISGQLAWVGIIAIAGFLEPGYSEIRDAVSELGADTATRPWLFNVAVAVWGLSFIAVAIGLLLDGPPGLRGWLGPLLIALNTAAVHTFMLATGRPRPLSTSRTSA